MRKLIFVAIFGGALLLPMSCSVDLSSDEAKAGYGEGYEWGEGYPIDRYTDREFAIGLERKMEAYATQLSRVDNSDDRSLLSRTTKGWKQGAEDARAGKARQVSRSESREGGQQVLKRMRSR